MSPRKLSPHPTAAELNILRVLWSLQEATVRQVVDVLNETGEVGYTTALKLMQIMTDKGLVTRDESQRSHRYCAAIPEEAMQHQLLNDLLTRAFGGSAQKLVLRALSEHVTTPKELAEIRKQLDALEQRRKKS